MSDIGARPAVRLGRWDGTWEGMRAALDQMAGQLEEWHGIPAPIEGYRIRLHDRHPWRDKFATLFDDEEPAPAEEDNGERIVNAWTSRARQCRVYVVRRPDGTAYAVTDRLPPDGAMQRLTFWMRTLGASDAWDEKAEAKAREKLRGMVTERQWRHYDLTGSFLETSPRSDVIYVYRRLRPTLALTPRWREREGREPPDSIRCLAVLCLHPLGYYEATWAGCMVPTDDVIAHLTMCRADEPYFWKCANQHDPASPEAGL